MTTEERLLDLEQRVIPQLLQRIGALEDAQSHRAQVNDGQKAIDRGRALSAQPDPHKEGKPERKEGGDFIVPDDWYRRKP